MVISIGTDCSGMDAPIQAIKNLKIDYIHKFSSDIDKYCIQTIKANFNPEIIFGDITKRDIKKVPYVDIYVSGFPCQPFSQAGKRLGFEDKYRGNIFFYCYDVIKTIKPKCFILENVRGILTHNKKKTFKTIICKLNELKDYKVSWKLLNTKDYGIPHSRPRVFIIGLKGDKDIKWPKERKMKKLNSYIDHKDNHKDIIVDKNVLKSDVFDRIPKESKFINLNFRNNKFLQSDKICPCITSFPRMWCVTKNRWMNIKEYLSLQGFPKRFKQVISNFQLKKQIGNSISVNVIQILLKECIKIIDSFIII